VRVEGEQRGGLRESKGEGGGWARGRDEGGRGGGRRGGGGAERGGGGRGGGGGEGGGRGGEEGGEGRGEEGEEGVDVLVSVEWKFSSFHACI